MKMMIVKMMMILLKVYLSISHHITTLTTPLPLESVQKVIKDENCIPIASSKNTKSRQGKSNDNKKGDVLETTSKGKSRMVKSNAEKIPLKDVTNERIRYYNV